MFKQNVFVYYRRIIMLVITALIYSTANTHASNPLEPKTQPTESQAMYAQDQIIVKFKHSLTKCPHCLLTQKQSFQGATTDLSDSLDQLNQRYGVYRITPLLRSHVDEQNIKARQGISGAIDIQSLTDFWQNKVTRIREKFIKRSARAPREKPAPDLSHVYLFEVSLGENIEETCQMYQADPHVEYAQPNYIVRGDGVPDDPFLHSSGSWGQPYDDLWNVKIINADQAWDQSQGEGVVVAIVDSGIDYNHGDLADNVWINNGEIPGDGIDNDENGYIDDVRGWDFTNCEEYNLSTFNCNQPKSPDNDPIDGLGHGSHVSGITGSVGNNGLGLIGVAHQVQLMALKSLNDQRPSGFGTEEVHAEAIHYAVAEGADVINASWFADPGGPDHPLIREAVELATSMGVLVVAAAGNEGSDTFLLNHHPAVLKDVIAVAATTQLDTPASFSNHGIALDVAAPGGGTSPTSNVISTIPFDSEFYNDLPGLIVESPNPDDTGPYMRLAGTSMSTPHVSGIAALLMSLHEDWNIDEIRSAIRASTSDLGDLGTDARFGYGRVDAKSAVDLTDPLVVKISSVHPRDPKEPFVFVVKGSVTGHGLIKYTLEAGEGLFPTEWATLMEGTMPVDQNIISKWDAKGLGGVYTLRLTAVNHNDVVFEDRETIPLTVLIEKSDSEILHPDVAFDGRYMVTVWEKDEQIMLRRVRKDGIVIDDEPLVLTDDNHKAIKPSIACNQGQCLVVWSQEEEGNPYIYDVYGALVKTRITPASQLSVQPPSPEFKVFPVATAELTQVGTEVAFNGKDYWVTWSDERNQGGSLVFSFYGTRVTTRGRVVDFDGVELFEDGTYSGARLACAENGNCLAVWTERISFDSQVRGLLLSPEGEVLTDPPSILAGPFFGTNLLLYQIAVTSDGTDFLVAWEKLLFGGSNLAFVEGIRVHADGTSDGELIIHIDYQSPAQDPTLGFDGENYVVHWHKLPGYLMQNHINKKGDIVFDLDSMVGLTRDDYPEPQSATALKGVFLLLMDDTPNFQLKGAFLPKKKR